jgi:hypothetical protein
MARIWLQRQTYIYIYVCVCVCIYLFRYFTSLDLCPFIFSAYVLVSSLGVYAEVRYFVIRYDVSKRCL